MSEFEGAPPLWAVHGAKCVCIVTSWDPPDDGIDVPWFAPAKDDVLTVDKTNGAWLQFEELPALYTRPDGAVGRLWWPADSFRPFVSLKDDIAIFAPLLGARQPELERT